MPVVLIAAVGWLALSNHCALAAIEHGTAKAVMSCHGLPTKNHAPAKEDRDGAECCKVVRATLLTPAKSAVSLYQLLFEPHKYLVAGTRLAGGR